jgi:hypothetical protein
MSMATKTIVCPECQAPAAPGRYACEQCGALLASLALAAPADRPSKGALAAADGSMGALAGASIDSMEPATTDHTRSISPAPTWTHALAADPDDGEPILPPPGEDERWDDEPQSARANVADVTPATPKRAPAPRVKAARTPRSAPKRTAAALARIARAVSPPAVEAPSAAMPPATEGEPDRAPAAVEWPVVDERPVADAWPVVDDPVAATDPATPTTPVPDPVLDEDGEGAVTAPMPAWPPPGSFGVLATPVPRIPAGAYLPPSAVLPPGETVPPATANGGAASADTKAAPAPSALPSGAARLAELGLPADTPRRVVAIGAFVAMLGFLLPWAGVGSGTALIDSYLVVWGLAGAGHWLVVAALVVIEGVAISSGRLSRVPVGVAAVALAALLLGLSWSTLFGSAGRPVGIWVVLGGAILLAAGGLLDLRAGRHVGSDPIV